MDDFSKKISDSLNAPADLPFDEAAWDRLSDRLHEKPDKKRWLPWLASLGLFLFFIPTVFSWLIYQKLGEANSKIEHLENFLKSGAVASVDTTMQHKVTIVYDTIYQNKIISKINGQQLNAHIPRATNYLSQARTNYISDKERSTQFLPHEFTLKNSHDFRIINPSSYSQKKLAFNKKENTLSLSFISPHPINLMPPEKEPTLNLNPIQPIVVKKKKGIRYYFHKMQPKQFSLGLMGGIPFHIDGGADTYVEVNADIGYGDNLSLNIGAGYLQRKLGNTFTNYGITNSDFPNVEPNAPSDFLSEINSQVNYLQIPIRLTYNFLKKKNIQPIIGGGVIVHRAVSAQADYIFQGIYNQYEIRKEDLLGNGFQFASVTGNLGFQYLLNNNWRIQLDGSFQHDIQKGAHNFEDFDLFMFRGGVRYKF